MLVRDVHAATLLGIRLINTFDALEPDPESLSTPEALRAFLRMNGVAAQSVRARDLNEIQSLRDRLRLVFERPPLRAKARALNELLEQAPTRPAVVASGDEWLQTVDVDDNSSLARRLAVICAFGLADAVGRYGSERLKVCEAAPCDNVFIDLSKNLVRRHCSRRCANRASAAAFRARQRPMVRR